MNCFAGRTNWDLRTNELTAIVAQIKQSGKAFYDLTISNPTCCGFSYPEKNFLDLLSQEKNMSYHADSKGLLSAREAVISYYQEKGNIISADQLLLTASTSEAYSFLFRLLVDPGDKVIFPKPSYPLFEFLAGINDVNWETYQLIYDECWRLDRKQFSTSLANAKAAILVNPNNPTGSCFSADDMDFIYQQCCEHQVPIICDEVFLDYGFDGSGKIQSLVGRSDQLTFVLSGLSKSLALPQMKLSWIAVNGPQDLIDESIKRLEVIADTYLSVNTPVQHALATWMTSLGPVRDQVLQRVRQNREFLSSYISSVGKKATLLAADGGWSVVVKAQDAQDEENFVKSLLEDDQVFVHPGYFFDFNDEGFFVISLLPPKEIFEEGIKRFLARI